MVFSFSVQIYRGRYYLSTTLPTNLPTNQPRLGRCKCSKGTKAPNSLEDRKSDKIVKA